MDHPLPVPGLHSNASNGLPYHSTLLVPWPRLPQDSIPRHTDKKENKIFLICEEIQMGSGAKSYMGKGFLIYGEMRKFFPIYEEAVSHI